MNDDTIGGLPASSIDGPLDHESWGVRFMLVALGLAVLALVGGICGLVAVGMAITKAVGTW